MNGLNGRAAAIGFVAGAASALTFHAAVWYAFYLMGINRAPPYPMIANAWGVPVIVSLAFWAGIWGIIMVLLAPRLGWPFWMVAVAVSVIATLVQLYVIPTLRGTPIVAGADPMAILRGLFANGVWGLGVAFFVSLMQRVRLAA